MGCGGETTDEVAPPGSPNPSVSTNAVNDRCASARTLSLSPSPVEIHDETASVTDEFPDLDCGSRGTAAALHGPQRYYRLSLLKGRTYTFSLNPGFHSVVYGFEASVGCSEKAITTACKSGGSSGFASALINPGTGSPGATVFGVPPPFVAGHDMEFILVVDSDGASGGFNLKISERAE